jgi:hypothetical protein
MSLRDHNPITIDRFNGLWAQGDIDSTPKDHFSDCDNIRYFGTNSFATRYGVSPHQNVLGPLGNIVRVYNYVTITANTLLVLTYDGANGKIYHVVDDTTVHGPLLTIAGMTDFAFTPYGGRAYISPFKDFTFGNLVIQKGMSSEFLYVYLGDGTACRKAAGSTPAGTITVANGAAGHTDAGLKIFGVVGETDSGFLSAPCALKTFNTNAALSVSFTTIPTFAGAQWVKRHIVASITIPSYDGNLEGYDLFFIPGATINDNVTTSLANQSFYDADLLENASDLFDIYSEIPAGCHLSLYHGRLMLSTTYTDINLCLVSLDGQPEAFSTIDGFLSVTPDGNPLTNGQELRDIYYLTKRNRTIAYTDNGDVPSSWLPTIIDLALGASVHGIATVLDSGSTSVDFLIMATLRGIVLFNGRFILPELSWKIYDFWSLLNKNDYGKIQIVNDSISQILYVVLTDGRMLVGNYTNGLDPMKIRWTPWSFDINIRTVALVDTNSLILGSDGLFEG